MSQGNAPRTRYPGRANFRLTPRDEYLLGALAERESGGNESELFRFLIRRRAEEVGIEYTPGAKAGRGA